MRSQDQAHQLLGSLLDELSCVLSPCSKDLQSTWQRLHGHPVLSALAGGVLSWTPSLVCCTVVKLSGMPTEASDGDVAYGLWHSTECSTKMQRQTPGIFSLVSMDFDFEHLMMFASRHSRSRSLETMAAHTHVMQDLKLIKFGTTAVWTYSAFDLDCISIINDQLSWPLPPSASSLHHSRYLQPTCTSDHTSQPGNSVDC